MEYAVYLFCIFTYVKNSHVENPSAQTVYIRSYVKQINMKRRYSSYIMKKHISFKYVLCIEKRMA